MFIPLGTDRPRKRRSVVTPILILLCLVAGLAQVFAGQIDPNWWFGTNQTLGAYYSLMIQGGEGFRAWQLLTSAFMHGGIIHFAGNMLFLWIFGQLVEDRLGRIGFLALYLGGAMISAAAHALLEPVPALGASGAVAAVTGAFIILAPRTRVRVFSLLIVLGIFMVPAWWLIGFSIVWDFFSQALGGNTGVAHIAHLAGYATGASVAFALLASGILPREMYDVFSMAKQAKRRQDLKAAGVIADRRGAQRVANKVDPIADAAREKLAADRAEILRLVAEGDHVEAAERWWALREQEDAEPRRATLARDPQLAILSHCYAVGAFEHAATACHDFLDLYPMDREADEIRILHARLLGRALGRTSEAFTILDGLADKPRVAQLAEEEREAIRAAEPIAVEDMA